MRTKSLRNALIDLNTAARMPLKFASVTDDGVFIVNIGHYSWGNIDDAWTLIQTVDKKGTIEIISPQFDTINELIDFIRSETILYNEE